MKIYRTTIAIIAGIFIAFSAVAAPFVARSGCFLGCGPDGFFSSGGGDSAAKSVGLFGGRGPFQGPEFSRDEDAEGDGSRWPSPNEIAGPDVVGTEDGAPEFVISVDLRDSVSVVTSLNRAGATLLRDQTLVHLGMRLLVFSLPSALPADEARALLAQLAPDAAFDLHHIYRHAAGPRIYHAAMLGDAPGQTCRVAQPIRVGVIDGPVNSAHPALKLVPVTQQQFLGIGETVTSQHHGTAVAGLIAGEAGAGPLAGLAPGVALYAAEVFGEGEKGEGARLESVAIGLDWLIGQEVRLINMSFVGEPNATFAKLLQAARDKGAVIIAAAGNNRSDTAMYPAASPDTIAVTAVDAAGRLYRQANFGEHIEFAAPGVDLYVAWEMEGSYRSGTSFATPVVTALLAREAENAPVSLERAREVLQSDVRDLGPGGWDAKFGFGLVQSGGC
ncbi:MAG: S8 family serine peptidase [Pseudomonadota bacterium]